MIIIQPSYRVLVPPIPFSVARGSAYYNATNSSSYGYTSTFPLTPSDTRHIIVGYTAAAGGGTAVSASIGGITATKIAEQSSGGNVCGFFIANVPTGTSGNITVNMSATQTGMIMHSWGLDGLTTTTGASAGAQSSSINVSTGAAAPGAYFYAILAVGSSFGVSGTSAVNTDTSTSNTTLAYGPVQESTSYFHGLADFTPHEYGGSATCNVSVSATISALALW